MTVAIVNFNAGHYLSNTLTGLAAQTETRFKAIIVDNASSDQSIADARACLQGDNRFEFIMLSTNTGFAAANNLAARRTDTLWFALLNPDAIPDRDWLEQLLAATGRHPKAMMFGSTQIDQNNPDLLDGAGDRYFALGIPWRGGHGWPRKALPPEGEVFSPCAAAALYRTDIYRAAGGLEESFFCYVEDVDLAFRLRLQGHRCIQVPTAIVRHAGSITSGGRNSAFARYHGTRNMIWCFVRNMPGLLFYPLLPLHLAAMLLLWLRAFATGMWRPVGRGIVDALRGFAPIWRQRHIIQTARSAPALHIAEWLTWKPQDYLRRAPGIISRARS
ncbi:glycosyltransferase family 2 protein [Ferrovibrio terrae]|uniref:glycosyltransferase family 2 protein n=1 Tax=Ferrovibrio terrae TaxID=2594003 RepID=UPI0031382C41